MHFKPYSTALLLSAAFLSSLFLRGTAYAEGSYTVHPWEFHERRATGHRILDVSDNEIYDFYYNSPHRSVTHGLHPENRRRYYNPRPYTYLSDYGLFGDYSDTEIYEYDAERGRWVRGSKSSAKPAVGSDCMNYTFKKPNYRVPPFGYRCER